MPVLTEKFAAYMEKVTDQYRDRAQLGDRPVADFTFAPDDLLVVFTNTSTDSDGTLASYEWKFGDGGRSTTASPQHTYAEAGTYRVSLVAYDDDGNEHWVAKDVTVEEGEVE